MKSKKVLFIYRILEDDPKYIGILQKMHGQINALKAQALEVHHTTLNSQGMLLDGKLIQKRPLKIKLSRYNYFYKSYFYDLFTIIQDGNYQALYIRHFIATRHFIRFLEYTKNHNPHLKVLLEIPTYPYMHEYRSFLQRIALKMDIKWRNHLHNYVDHVVHFGSEKALWAIECINISNGVSIPKEFRYSSNKKETLVFIGVGNLEYWWGLEEFIISFADYIKKNEKKLRLIIVGGGRLLKHLKSLTQDFNIEDKVTFSRFKSGEELEQLLQESHIGVGTLAMEKKGLSYTSSLKHRLYTSYGLPFIMKGIDHDFMDVKWVLGMQQEKKLDIQEILDWYDSISLDPSLQESITKFAKSNLSWNTKFIPVVKAIKDQ